MLQNGLSFSLANSDIVLRHEAGRIERGLIGVGKFPGATTQQDTTVSYIHF
jgi:hypothetical protein